jgi:hypothetical protein
MNYRYSQQRIANMAEFKVGDKVAFQLWGTTGTVIQVEGGPFGDLTEVFWPLHGQAIWVKTNVLTRPQP